MIHDNMGLEKERLQSKVMGSPLNETKKKGFNTGKGLEFNLSIGLNLHGTDNDPGHGRHEQEAEVPRHWTRPAVSSISSLGTLSLRRK